MANNTLAQPTSERSYIAHWIEWKLYRVSGGVRKEFTMPERRGQQNMTGGDRATHFVFLYARYHGLFTPEEWRSVEVWHTFTAKYRRAFMATIYERVFRIPFPELLRQCNVIENNRERQALADWMSDIMTCLAGVRNIPRWREPYACPLEGVELPEDRLLRRARKPVEPQMDAPPTTSLASAFLALLRKATEETPISTVGALPAPAEMPAQELPFSSALADMVEFALNHDLGLLA